MKWDEMSPYQQEMFDAYVNKLYDHGMMLCQPHVLMRPDLRLDGDQWSALYGDNIQEGCAGFGPTPEAAMADFDSHWRGEGHAGEAAK